MISSRFVCALAFPLLLASFGAQAQGVFSRDAQAAMPSDEAVRQAQTRITEAMGKIPNTPTGASLQTPTGMAKIDALPKPATSAPDIAEIAERFKDVAKNAVPKKSGPPELLVLVSLSMPKEAIQRIAEQAERAGASMVFRGLKGGSMKEMAKEIQAITGTRNNLSIAIHPPAFQQFSVKQVPAVVLATPAAGNVMDDGCAEAETFIKVTGDVSLDYALEYIERKNQRWASVAKFYRDKIIQGGN